MTDKEYEAIVGTYIMMAFVILFFAGNWWAYQGRLSEQIAKQNWEAYEARVNAKNALYQSPRTAEQSEKMIQEKFEASYKQWEELMDAQAKENGWIKIERRPTGDVEVPID